MVDNKTGMGGGVEEAKQRGMAVNVPDSTGELWRVSCASEGRCLSRPHTGQVTGVVGSRQGPKLAGTGCVGKAAMVAKGISSKEELQASTLGSKSPPKLRTGKL